MSLSLSGAGFRNQHIEYEVAPGQAPYWHDLKITTGDVALTTSIGLARGIGVEALVPFRMNRERVTFRALDGSPYEPDPPDVHHANRTLLGFADPWLLAHAGFRRGAWSWGARTGMSIPLGGTVEDPFALGTAGLPHEHIQFGTGTVNPIVAFGVARSFGAWSISARGLGRFGVWRNEHGYRAGDQRLGSLVVASKLGLARWTFEAGSTVFREEAETWGGEVQYEGNLGRTDVYADARAGFMVNRGLSLGAELRVPLHSHATGAQLDLPLSLRVSASHGFMWRMP